jgi:hypothetical protein
VTRFRQQPERKEATMYNNRISEESTSPLLQIQKEGMKRGNPVQETTEPKNTKNAPTNTPTLNEPTPMKTERSEQTMNQGEKKKPGEVGFSIDIKA